MRLRSFLRTSSKNNSVSRIIDTFSKWSNSGYKMWLGSVASISRSASHWPTKFSVKGDAKSGASTRHRKHDQNGGEEAEDGIIGAIPLAALEWRLALCPGRSPA